MGSDGIRSKVWQKTVAFDYDGVEPMVFCVFRKAEGAVMICVVKNAGFTKSNLVLYGDWATTSGYWPTIGWWFHSLFTKTWDDDPQGLIVSGCFNQSTRPVCFIQTSMDHYGNSDIHAQIITKARLTRTRNQIILLLKSQQGWFFFFCCGRYR